MERRATRIGLFFLCVTCAHAQTLADVPFRTVEAMWNFNDGLDSWARSSTNTMHAEINPQNGYIHGAVIDDSPFVDSPLMELEITDRHYFVVRMSYEGSCAQASILLERSGTPIVPATNTKASFVKPLELRFPITSDATQHVYYVPLYTSYQGEVSRIRFFPCRTKARGGQTFHIDWIVLAKAPTITKVRGCIDRYFQSSDLRTPVAAVSLVTTLTNSIHPVFNTFFQTMNLPYATTYNCMAGDTVRIQGRNFGDSALARINGVPCSNQPLISTPLIAADRSNEEVISCVVPPGPPGPVVVTIQNEQYRGLQFDGPLLAYAVPANVVAPPTLSNVMSHAVDVTWALPPDLWTSLTVTGYALQVTATASTTTATTITGNVTTTTLTGLAPNTVYSITVTALVESQNTTAWQTVDMYGQRAALPSAIFGRASPPLVFTTLGTDVIFAGFSAKSTLNQSATVVGTTLGPTGDVGGQGALGLVLVGHAHIENCNATSSCCDLDASGTTCILSCRATTTRNAPSAPSIASLTVVSPASANAAPRPVACGPSLRLTGSAPYLTGAAWYPRPLNVREGFDTTFQFRLSNPSVHCNSMDDVYTHCRYGRVSLSQASAGLRGVFLDDVTTMTASHARARGGDGLAFVVQNQAAQPAMGRGGQELGYGGISNALSVEFDTTYNPDAHDVYENHISVHTRGAAQPNSAHHAYSLGATAQIPDLTDGIQTVRIRYVPAIEDDTIPFQPEFQATAYVSQFFAKTDADSRVHSSWASAGLGVLTIHLDGLPVLSVPLHLDATLQLKGGRAFVGFTAATGASAWQVHDILSWQIDSLRVLPPPAAPFVST
ncbi:Aste57867_14926 [Aphanomyces stellatus]|uniref:Aste57867_14926 protein n=1 Tax=Aphanomyces stellatus TaxID=120398 RepID=A0A485L2W7_9STRA|nr:hypothetical protein As57867_014870 [Aphanomyces stellatus]VFT91741.1 Aste57867_14926 [Aphanomyces stellatus]